MPAWATRDQERVGVAAVCFCYALVGAVQSGLLPATLTTVQARLRLDNTAMAVAVAGYEVAQVFASVPAGALATSVGAGRVLGAGSLLMAVGTLLFALAPGFLTLFVAQLLQGVGSATVSVLVPAYLAALAQDAHRAAFTLSLAYAATSAGVVVAYLLCAAVGPQLWRSLFAIHAAGFLVPFAVLSLVLPREPPLASLPFDAVLHEQINDDADDDNVDGAEEQQQVAAEVAVNVQAQHPPPTTWQSSPDLRPQQPPPQLLAGSFTSEAAASAPQPSVVSAALDWRSLLAEARVQVLLVVASRPVLWLIASQTATAFAVNAYIAFLPAFVERQLGQSAGTAALVTSALVPACTLGMLSSGLLSKRRRWNAVRLLQAVVIGCAATLPLTGAFLQHSLAGFCVLLLAAMFFLFFTQVPSVTAFQHLRVPVAAANALSNVTLRLFGSVPGPLALGFLLDHPQLVGPGAAYTIVGLAAGGTAALCALRSLTLITAGNSFLNRILAVVV